MSDYEFKGHDFEELLDCWGLKDDVKKIRDLLWELHQAGYHSTDEWMDLIDNIAPDAIRDYIELCTNFYGPEVRIDEDVKEDMINFLDAVRRDTCCSEGERMMIGALIVVAKTEKCDMTFYWWFRNNVEAFWT